MRKLTFITVFAFARFCKWSTQFCFVSCKTSMRMCSWYRQSRWDCGSGGGNSHWWMLYDVRYWYAWRWERWSRRFGWRIRRRRRWWIGIHTWHCYFYLEKKKKKKNNKKKLKSRIITLSLKKTFFFVFFQEKKTHIRQNECTAKRVVRWEDEKCVCVCVYRMEILLCVHSV